MLLWKAAHPTVDLLTGWQPKHPNLTRGNHNLQLCYDSLLPSRAPNHCKHVSILCVTFYGVQEAVWTNEKERLGKYKKRLNGAWQENCFNRSCSDKMKFC